MYPPWWEGRRYTRPIRAWICAQSAQKVRDGLQRLIFGSEFDTGFIPKAAILRTTPGHGITGQYEKIWIRHVSGGTSVVTTHYYTQDKMEFESDTLELVAFDEEPPEEVFSGSLMRLTGPGISYCTFTPLAGRTHVIDYFLYEKDAAKKAQRGVVQMSLDEAEHFTEEEKQQRIADMRPHERDARRYGEPLMGEGSVYETPVESLTIDQHFNIPLEYGKIWGIDFGSSVFAASLLAWDHLRDTVYVLDTVRLEGSRPIEHAAAIRAICPDAPVAWPHDGHMAERGTGEVIINQYKPHGLRLLGDHATHAKGGGFNVEAGIWEIQQRMSTGRLRVKAHLADWWDEFRGYHRALDSQGRSIIPKPQRDHLMDATRYAVMMLRYAKPVPLGPAMTPYSGRINRPRKATGLSFDPFNVNTGKASFGGIGR